MKRWLLLSVFCLAGCASTVIEQDAPLPAKPSQVGNSPTLGLIDRIWDPALKTFTGCDVDEDGRSYYNYLLGKFGATLKPPRSTDYGITLTSRTILDEAGNLQKVYRLSEDGYVDLYQMRLWDRSNEHPPKTLWQKITGKPAATITTGSENHRHHDGSAPACRDKNSAAILRKRQQHPLQRDAAKPFPQGRPSECL